MRDYYEDSDADDEENYSDEIGDRLFDIQDLFENEMPIGYSDLNTNRLVLESALRLLESSFWWKFRSHASKMKLLNATYRSLSSMLLETEEDVLDKILKDDEEENKE